MDCHYPQLPSEGAVRKEGRKEGWDERRDQKCISGGTRNFISEKKGEEDIFFHLSVYRLYRIGSEALNLMLNWHEAIGLEEGQLQKSRGITCDKPRTARVILSYYFSLDKLMQHLRAKQTSYSHFFKPTTCSSTVPRRAE
jgi:hypothetical protein